MRPLARECSTISWLQPAPFTKMCDAIPFIVESLSPPKQTSAFVVQYPRVLLVGLLRRCAVSPRAAFEDQSKAFRSVTFQDLKLETVTQDSRHAVSSFVFSVLSSVPGTNTALFSLTIWDFLLFPWLFSRFAGYSGGGGGGGRYDDGGYGGDRY
jgi:hypothetical protein